MCKNTDGGMANSATTVQASICLKNIYIMDHYEYGSRKSNLPQVYEDSSKRDHSDQEDIVSFP